MVALFNQRSEMVSSVLIGKPTAKIQAAEGCLAVITLPHPLPNGGQARDLEPLGSCKPSELIAIMQNLWLPHVFICHFLQWLH
jgi:hypothetical protein